ncbi:tRNA pseudouridine(38-40) synthase TruA [soil metagenome]
MPLVKLTFGYDGTDFYGSQAQTGRRTVQSELEAAVQEVGGGTHRLAFAGRTDRGVHAVGQVASGEIHWNSTLVSLRAGLNAVGPKDIVVSSVEVVDSDFHARFSARWREYRYRIVVTDVPPVLSQRCVWWRRDTLDDALAQDACQRLVGRHGFGSFASNGLSQSWPEAKLERTVLDCQWWHSADATSASGRFSELRIVATGFLPQMVRNIAGAVVQVASGAQPAGWIDELLSAGDRRMLKEGAPPHGLILWRVGYTEFGNGCQA